ncbi:hypothetical protein [Streptomyces sp. HD]|uniref:hypothetical protein n=1 Tax=Streptomyces sp. HD TaxID=3020892 RepID=UPI00232D8E76|nr:hypothetical protein [Streptomyces sp. HD]MDC0770184.1 hypothetical protein [Streptomyces sp. HD]
MTALSATAASPARTPSGPRGGLFRAVLRLHRTALVLWSLALAAATACLIWLHTIGDEARRGTSACAIPASDGLPSCTAVDAITADETYSTGIALVTTALSYVIFPVAAWAGGALIGRELESGTAQLAWTQSVTPTRWLAAKLAVPAALLTAGTGTLVLINRWAQGDGNPNLVGDWYFEDVFLGIGPTTVGYALAGLALGTLAGLLLRRALPAAGVGFAAAFVLYNLLERHRESLWPTAGRSPTHSSELPRSAWQTSSATFHPRSHFWPLQYAETGIAVAVAAAATLAAFWLLRRRTP